MYGRVSVLYEASAYSDFARTHAVSSSITYTTTQPATNTRIQILGIDPIPGLIPLTAYTTVQSLAITLESITSTDDYITVAYLSEAGAAVQQIQRIHTGQTLNLTDVTSGVGAAFQLSCTGANDSAYVVYNIFGTVP